MAPQEIEKVEIDNEKTEEKILSEKQREEVEFIDNILDTSPRFVGTLADTASDTLLKWLRKNTPPEVRILFQAVDYLRLAEGKENYRYTKNDNYFDNSCLTSSVWEAIWAIDKLGGSFYGAYGGTGAAEGD